MRCVVCHYEFKEGEEHIAARIWDLAYTPSGEWPYTEYIDEWEAIVCGKPHLLEYIEKTVQKANND